jgi:hypothetical protein
MPDFGEPIGWAEPTEQCHAYRDPFEMTDRCPETTNLRMHMGVKWCPEHVEAIKAAELRAIARTNESLSRRKI